MRLVNNDCRGGSLCPPDFQKQFLAAAQRFISRILRIVITPAVYLFLITGCVSPNEYSTSDFYAVIVSDTHISRDESKIDRLDKLSNMINTGMLPNVDFVINTGDVVSRVYGDYRPENPDSSDNRLRRAVEAFDRFQVPWYFVMGNHDYKIGPDRDSDTYFPKSELDSLEMIWERETGFKPYYVFDHKGWRFIVLNSMRGRYLHRHFDDSQMDWLKKQLFDKKPTILFFHHPMKTDNFTIWAHPNDVITEETEPIFYKIIKSYKNNIKGIFVGHGHRWVEDILFDTIRVYETNSFADENELMYYVVGFDTTSQEISVGENVLPDTHY
jgi:3',5'-cyclic AMP phosphodiesterase CpdA